MGKIKLTSLMLTLIFLVLTISVVYAADTTSCCEKTINGAFCQNAPQSECDSSFKVAPTSCDSTSYCKRGCCFDSAEGLCLENTPERVCEDSSGTWADSASCDIKQCNLGCCVLADQGAFVTLTRCKQLSGFYGIKTDFRTTITNEVQCIATASSADKGACVTEDSYSGGKTCKFTTRGQCSAPSAESTANITDNKTTASVGFYKNILCTAKTLGTDCAKTTKTTIVDGKDEIYYLDTCNNLANIYDANKYNDNSYWTNVYTKAQSCGSGSSNGGSKTCGNCDYYLGSIGKRSSGLLNQPTYGNYICVDLSCKSEGKKHGESWCKFDSPSGNGEDTVGSAYYKEICYMGEIITEPCADFRNQICIEGTFGSFTEAQCRVNRWQTCTAQLEQKDCENTDQRDCKWIEGWYFSGTSSGVVKSTNDSNNDGNTNDPTVSGLCMPNYPPGFQFYTSDAVSSGTSTSTSSSFASSTPTFNATTPGFGTGAVTETSASNSGPSICSLANSDIKIKWTRTDQPLKFYGQSKGDWSCDSVTGNCQYLTDKSKNNPDAFGENEVKTIASEMNKICANLGDCGGKTNWIGAYTDDGYAGYFNNKRLAGSGGAEVITPSKATSNSATGTAATGTPAATGTDTASSTLNAASQLGSLGSGGTTGKVVKTDITGNLIKWITGGK